MSRHLLYYLIQNNCYKIFAWRSKFLQVCAANLELADYPAMSFVLACWQIKIKIQISWAGRSTILGWQCQDFLCNKKIILLDNAKFANCENIPKVHSIWMLVNWTAGFIVWSVKFKTTSNYKSSNKTSQELRMLSNVTLNCHVLNCQNCNQCLKCHKSLRLSLSLYLFQRSSKEVLKKF